MAKATVYRGRSMDAKRPEERLRLRDRRTVKLLEWRAKDTLIHFSRLRENTHRTIIRDWGINE